LGEGDKALGSPSNLLEILNPPINLLKKF